MSVCTVPPLGRNSSVSTTKEHNGRGGHSKGRLARSLVGWHRLLTPCGRVLQTPSEAPKEQILPGISQAHVPRGRGHSGKQGGCRRLPLSPTVKTGSSRATR